MRRCSIRPYDSDAAAAVVEFFELSAQKDKTLRPMSLAHWEAYVSSDFNRDGKDFRLAEIDNEVVGLLMSHETDQPDESNSVRHLNIVVRPRNRRRGIATALLDEVTRLDPEGDEVTLQARPHEGWVIGQRFLKAFGFQVTRRELAMRWSGGVVPRHDLPDGYRIRSLDPSRDGEALADVHNEAYRLGHHAHRLSPSSFDPAQQYPGTAFLVAHRDDRPVGYVQTLPEGDDQGYVESIAVHPNHQGKGLGRALLRAGMQSLHREGFEEIGLSVSEDNVPAVSLYRSIGFEDGCTTSYFTADRTEVRARLPR